MTILKLPLRAKAGHLLVDLELAGRALLRKAFARICVCTRLVSLRVDDGELVGLILGLEET